MKVKMAESEPKIIEAEVVRNADPDSVERVSVSRVDSHRWFRKVLAPESVQEEGRKGLRDMRLRLWAWLVGLAIPACGFIYAAVTADVVIWSAFLLLAGVLCALGAAAVAAVIWAVRRLLPR
jgi:hypothetical protein